MRDRRSEQSVKECQKSGFLTFFKEAFGIVKRAFGKGAREPDSERRHRRFRVRMGSGQGREDLARGGRRVVGADDRAPDDD
ncbi:MAG: hypothetical protein AAFU55_04345, partial [Pseudomonadota bacterium]